MVTGWMLIVEIYKRNSENGIEKNDINLTKLFTISNLIKIL